MNSQDREIQRKLKVLPRAEQTGYANPEAHETFQHILLVRKPYRRREFAAQLCKVLDEAG